VALVSIVMTTVLATYRAFSNSSRAYIALFTNDNAGPLTNMTNVVSPPKHAVRHLLFVTPACTFAAAHAQRRDTLPYMYAPFATRLQRSPVSVRCFAH